MKKTILVIMVFMFAKRTVFAQTGVSLEVEIKNIEVSAARQGISAVEKHDAFVRLARLRQLSGDIEGAVSDWFDAAVAVPDRLDEDALLSCAYCLTAMGEWDRAIAALEPLVSKSPRARFLDTGIKAIKTGDSSALAALADNPAYSQMKAEILFVLWKLAQISPKESVNDSAAEKWRQRLINEFPAAPEGLIAAGKPYPVIVMPSPFWLFAGGLDSLLVLASEKPQETTSGSMTETAQAAGTVQTINVVQTTTQTSVSQSSASQVNAPQTSATTQTTVSRQPTQSAVTVNVRLQTGIFSREANAQTQFANLKQAGFSPSIEQRTVGGNEMWAVTVPADSDANKTKAALRSAGFDSFPIR
jgi:cell division septation protein DedD